ncbi:hypothetical protein [uncultured Tenacibaculum sp.]|uniref:hypothetical protein n=1 Tax=uncultured Tenacibaculum sp. TaxID=174713 RepID=UPI0026375865|nr:hypothetical protein [uncultured Tenacibaculum sp.]
MRKLSPLLLISIISFSSCSDNTDCLAKKEEINNYYESLIENGSLSSKELEKLQADWNGKLEELDCD